MTDIGHEQSFNRRLSDDNIVAVLSYIKSPSLLDISRQHNLVNERVREHAQK